MEVSQESFLKVTTIWARSFREESRKKRACLEKKNFGINYTDQELQLEKSAYTV